MPLPDSVRVHGRIYKIVRAPYSDITKIAEEDDPCMGCCEVWSTTIYIANELSDSQAWATLEHEIAHAAAYESGARHCFMSLKKEEDLVRVWFPVYTETLKDLYQRKS